jgi:hypothetical protein
MFKNWLASTSALVLLIAAGCTGKIGNGGPGVPGGSSTGVGGGGSALGGRGGVSTGAAAGTGTNPADPGDPNAAGPMPLRRLNRSEYNNTVRDLLGDTTQPANAFPLDRDPEFLYPRAGLASLQDVGTLKDAARALGLAAEAKATTLAPCATGMTEDACARAFVTSFGLKAYRRPVAADELTRLMALYTTGRSTLGLTYAGAVGFLVEGILQSPAFLYHWELGNNLPTLEGNVVKLGPYETAARLSYFIYGSMPDQPLFDAAAANRLATPADVEAQARRMLADPKGQDAVATFTEDWLNLDLVTTLPKDPNVYPEFVDALRTADRTETRAFIAAVMKGDQHLSTLLLGTNATVTQPVAALYGLPAVSATGTADTTLDPRQRAGLLTRASFLTVTGATDGSHPVKRGRRIYERLMCNVLPPPPNTIPAVVPASAAVGKTTRQRFEDHDKNPCAGACHAFMDPLGFAFENYDGIGRFRTMDNGGTVDASGMIKLDGGVHTFDNAVDLSHILATSTTVAGCYATQWFRYATNRAETDGDRASINGVKAALTKSNSITDLLVGIATSRSFRYRAPGLQEQLQ